MKRIYTLMIALLAISTGTWAQTTYYWQPTTGGAWGTAANWRTNPNGTGGSRTTPQNSDILIIDQEGSQTITGVGSQTIGGLRILSGAITLQGAGGNNTLTIGNSSTGADLRISAGASANVESSLEVIAFNNNATADISGELALSNTYNLASNTTTTVSSTGVIRNAGTISNATAAKLVINGTFVHDRAGGTIPTANWDNASVFELNIISNSLPTGLDQSFGHMLVSGNVTNNLNLNTSFSVAGNFTFETTGNGEVRISNNGTNRTVAVAGNFVQRSGVLVAVDDDGNVTLNVGGNYEMNGGSFYLKNDEGTATMTVAGNFTVTNGAFFLRNSTGGNATVNVTGLFDLQNGTMNMSSVNSVGTLNLRGGFSQSGGTITETSSSSGSIVFTGTASQTFTKSAGSIQNAINVSMNANSVVDFGTSVLDNTGGSFTLNAGANIITSHDQGLRSTGAFGTIRSNSRSYGGTANYEFRGASTGIFTTTTGGGNGVSNLTINRASGEIVANTSFTVAGVLALENGYITPGTNNLIVATTGSATSNNGAYVNGPLSKIISATNNVFTFYVGDAATTGLRPLVFRSANGGGAGAGTSTFTATFVRGSANSLSTTMGSGIARVSSCEYWTLTRSGGSRNGAVTIGWDASSDCSPTAPYITNPATVRVARLDGTTWTNAGGGVDGTPNSTVGTFTTGNNTNFTAYALASTNLADNPLPVLFDGVRAYAKNEGVQLEWSNLTEREIVRYEVERSSNGVDFYPINQQAPKSNRDDKASYTHFDASPVNGANFYRIRVDEIGGKPVYSKILRVEMGSTKVGFSLYPNPVVGKQLTVSLSGVRQGQYNLEVFSATGQRVYATRINNVGSGVTQMIELPASVKSGAYVTVISGDTYRESKQFIVK